MLSTLWFKIKQLVASADKIAWMWLIAGVIAGMTYLSCYIEFNNPIIAPQHLATFHGLITEVDVNGRFMHGRRGSKDPIITVCAKDDCRKFYFEIFVMGYEKAKVLHQIKTPVTVYYQPNYAQLLPPFRFNALWEIESTPKIDVQPYETTYKNHQAHRGVIFWFDVFVFLIPSVLCFVIFWVRVYRLNNLKSIGVPNAN